MILQKEIATIAEQTGVAKAVIDKDWVLGHFIAAMFSEPQIKQGLVFKGGTCLRKCWFPGYRFSEDLDYTAKSQDFELTERHVKDICDRLNAHAGMRTHMASLRPIVFRDEKVGYEAIVKYWGADHPKNEAPAPPERWQTKIKIEVIRYEQMIFDPVEKTLLHPYSDNLLPVGSIPCYTIEEVLSEKIRALIQRSCTAPRDFYDIWYLSNNMPGLDWKAIVEAFLVKMEYKGLEFKGIDQFINPKNERAVQLAWKNSLAHQIPADSLPKYEEVRADLLALFDNKFG